MSGTDDTIETAHGRLDRAALRALQDSYDTTALLRMVDDVDMLLARIREEDGLRDRLLRLHGMAHTVVNGAGIAVPTGEESLPALACDISAEVLRAVTQLRVWLWILEPLEQLRSRS